MTVTDVDRFLRIVGGLDRFLVEVLDPALDEHGIGREHWRVLRLLEDGTGRSMGEISAALGLPAATTTRVIDALVARMLVYRRGDPGDRRRVLVHLSEPGHESLEHVEAAFRSNSAPLLGRFSKNERRELVQLLERLVGEPAA